MRARHRFRETPDADRSLFLPMSREDMEQRGWDRLDVILVTGDPYIDHPSFGVPVIGRYLESLGYRVGIISQPDWKTSEAFTPLGRPRLFVGISAGVLDSMVSNYTAGKKFRRADAYAAGGRGGARPNRAAIVYANRFREVFPGIPVVLGGIEASMRRLAHYDYWEDRVRRSILLDARADIVVWGNGELAAGEIARRIEEGRDLLGIRGTAVEGPLDRQRELAGGTDDGFLELPSWEHLRSDEGKRAFLRAALRIERELSPFSGRTLVQGHGDRVVVVYPPSRPLTRSEIDGVYDLPFTYLPHPGYAERIPAYETIRFSITTHRGCFGGCTFCAISAHQGRIVQSRSPESILGEVEKLKGLPGFTGVISDLGGPTANMYGMGCAAPDAERVCRRTSCVHPGACRRLSLDHGPLVDLMRRVRSVQGVRHVYVASGIRHDLSLRSPEYLRELVTHHVGGHLKVAPEHTSDRILARMKKPSIQAYERFEEEFGRLSRDAGKEQYLVPYFISSFPSCELEDMHQAMAFIEGKGYRLEQVQDFIPTPMTLATAMYHTGLDLEGHPIFVARTHAERRIQQAMLRPHDPRNRVLLERHGIRRRRRTRRSHR